MAREISVALRDAIDLQGSYVMGSYLEVSPSRIFFDSLTLDNAISGADAVGIVNDPMRQDIEYSSEDLGIVTFFCDGVLKYAIQGSATVTTTAYSSAVKPGVLGSKLYLYDGSNIKRYSIDWAAVSARSAAPLSQDVSVAVANVLAVHAVSDTQCIAIQNDNGGLRVVLLSGTDVYSSDGRFMFPLFIDWNVDNRTITELATFSCAAILDNKIFAYISNAQTGMMEGLFYDLQTETWSDIFTALPTDLNVSLCEFRVSNGYTHNGTIYICGVFNRTDIFGGENPYSLLIYSQDGKTFSIDRFTLVSDLGYRFLARVGADDHLYLANCNRVCHTQVTWVFDGVEGTSYDSLTVLSEDIKKISDSNCERLSVSLRAGKEEFFDSSYIAEEARVKLYVGLETVSGGEAVDEYVLYGVYIIDSIDFSLSPGNRDMVIRAINEAMWKISGLSMPFYAELHGKSSLFDPMTEVSGKLDTATGGARTVTFFHVDFWEHEPYNNSGAGITGISMLSNGGPNYYETAGSHKLGIIMANQVMTELGLNENPKITETSLTVKIYGWSHPVTSGQTGDIVEIVLQLIDEDGNVSVVISNDDTRWPKTYPDTAAGEEPISITLTGLTVGYRIKKVGIVFENTVASWFNIARVEFTNNVEVPITFAKSNTPWEVQDDGTFKVPSAGRPFIMFAQRPFNAYNFTIAAMFDNTITGGIAGYPAAAGLVGHAQDANNFILASYDIVSEKVQLTLNRAGIAAVLAEEEPAWAVGTLNGIQFSHRNGTYDIYMYRESTERFELVLTYDWKTADGFMFTSETASMRCGIYGSIGAPFARILSFNIGATDDTIDAEGIPIDSLYSLADFPASGDIRIRDNVYSYDGIIAHPTVARGPYQFRQMNVYSPPYGNGKAGIECRDFDWTALTTLIDGKLIAFDSGYNFVASGALWQTFNSTGGVTNYFYNRARYYSDNSQIAKINHSLYNRVWVTGGFDNVSVKSGNPMKHGIGELAVLELPGSIQCRWFMGSGGEDDTTISDLISRVAALSGAQTSFPGDTIAETLNISGDTLILQDDYADGFDLYFETAVSPTFDIQTNVKINSEDYENGDDFDDDTGCKISVTDIGAGAYTVSLISTPSDTALYSALLSAGTEVQKFRVILHEDSLSFYRNNKWIVTITTDELIKDQTTYIRISANGSLTFSNVRVRELGDWREAIYIDMETDGRSAIGSIIQERPVEINSVYDGSLECWYILDRDEITQIVPPRTHSYTYSVPDGGASDAIVYGSKEVKTIQNSDFAKALGFGTKLMRLPNLNSGAIEATYIILKKVYEQRRRHSMTIRPDLSLMLGDLYSFSYEVVGTGRLVAATIVIEGVSLDFSVTGKKVSSGMKIQGREQ